MNLLKKGGFLSSFVAYKYVIYAEELSTTFVNGPHLGRSGYYGRQWSFYRAYTNKSPCSRRNHSTSKEKKMPEA